MSTAAVTAAVTPNVAVPLNAPAVVLTEVPADFTAVPAAVCTFLFTMVFAVADADFEAVSIELTVNIFSFSVLCPRRFLFLLMILDDHCFLDSSFWYILSYLFFCLLLRVLYNALLSSAITF